MLAAAVCLPLLGALLAGTLGHWFGSRFAQWTTCLTMAASALCSIIVLDSVSSNNTEGSEILFAWIHSGDIAVDWALRLDSLSAIMVFTVTFISTLIHIYSIGYMAHDRSVVRFMAYLSLFTFFMLALVTADNLVQLFFGWEGVGVASYLLIGFWYERSSANAAAIKAFIVNRISDFAFILGILATFITFGSTSFDIIFSAAPNIANQHFSFLSMQLNALETICLLLFIGAMGKSAQLGLHVWLPDAMEGPTPVSALIHAATMVTAGVFLMARLSPLLELAPITSNLIVIIGASTALFAATIGLVQNDIKRVVAYSTCSQLGYMFFAAGLGAYTAAIFHLVTHAFFKALLFLGAGSVIHALDDEQDLRNMGGLYRKLPWTYAFMCIGSLALVGLPPFAGYYSKDLILEVAYAHPGFPGSYAFILGLTAAFLTAFYSWRLLMMAFHGSPRAGDSVMARVHESPPVMLIPLASLALGAVFSGMLGFDIFAGKGRESFWQETISIPAQDPIEAAHHVPEWVIFAPIVITLAGIAFAVMLYGIIPSAPQMFARALQPFYLFLFNKWYFDEIYQALFVNRFYVISSKLWKKVDENIIDHFGPNGVATQAKRLAGRLSVMQTGYLSHYAFSMLVGVFLLVSSFLILSHL